jgi:hypothetical protein
MKGTRTCLVSSKAAAQAESPYWEMWMNEPEAVVKLPSNLLQPTRGHARTEQSEQPIEAQLQLGKASCTGAELYVMVVTRECALTAPPVRRVPDFHGDHIKVVTRS